MGEGKGATIILCSLVLAFITPFLCSVPSFSQDGLNSSLQQVMENPKIISPGWVTQEFSEPGKTSTRVIVLLRESKISEQPADWAPSKSSNSTPNSIMTSDVAGASGRLRIRARVQSALDRFLGAIDPTKIQKIKRFSYILGFSAEVTVEGLQQLVNDDQVVSVEEDRILSAHLAQGIPLMNASDIRSVYDGSQVAIAICDTGIDTSHPRLGNTATFPNSKVIGGYDIGDDDADPRPDPVSGEAHGTACAGIAAGDLGSVGDYVGGVAPGAKLYSVKISTGNTGSATTSNMIEGWEWCITHQYDNPAYPIMIISTSFGGGRSSSTCDDRVPAMTQAAANAAAAGITIFSSAGNDGYCDSICWPACISHVVSVGAVYDAAFGTYYPCVSADSCAVKYQGSCSTGWYAVDNAAPDQVPSYSNTAAFLGLLAPSNQAYTTDIVGTGGRSSGDYRSDFGGTSAASPYAAGAAAVLQSAARQILGRYLTPQEVKSLLVDKGDLVEDSKAGISKPRVNLAKAFAAMPIENALWNQPVSSVNTSAYADQDFEPALNAYDTFIADDFTSRQRWSVSKIFISGDTWKDGSTGCDLTCADMLHWMIYRGTGGVPDGYPDGGLGGGGDAPVWSISAPPNDSQVALTAGVGGHLTEVSLSLNLPIDLEPGTYWLFFYPSLSSEGCCQYGLRVSDTTNGNRAETINPGSEFNFGDVWTALSSAFSIPQHDLAFRLEGKRLKGITRTVPLMLLLD